MLGTASVRSPRRARAFSETQSHALRAAARAAAIVATAAFEARVAAAAAELLAEDARMAAGADSIPEGRGGGPKQPPDRRSVACCSPAGSQRACDGAARGAFWRGLRVPARGSQARLAIGTMLDACQGLKDGWQCTEEVSRDSDAMRSEGRRSADQGTGRTGVRARSATWRQNWRGSWPMMSYGQGKVKTAKIGSSSGCQSGFLGGQLFREKSTCDGGGQRWGAEQFSEHYFASSVGEINMMMECPA